VVFSNSIGLLKHISCDGHCFQRIFGTCIPLLSHKSIKSAYLLLFSSWILENKKKRKKKESAISQMQEHYIFLTEAKVENPN
jgi:hypothetical protein